MRLRLMIPTISKTSRFVFYRNFLGSCCNFRKVHNPVSGKNVETIYVPVEHNKRTYYIGSELKHECGNLNGAIHHEIRVTVKEFPMDAHIPEDAFLKAIYQEGTLTRAPKSNLSEIKEFISSNFEYRPPNKYGPVLEALSKFEPYSTSAQITPDRNKYRSGIPHRSIFDLFPNIKHQE